MNFDDIIRMAREAEFHVSGRRVLSPVIEGSDLTWLLERFATLVAAAEREACAEECENQKVGVRSYFEIDERIQWCADAIRARGNG